MGALVQIKLDESELVKSILRSHEDGMDISAIAFKRGMSYDETFDIIMTGQYSHIKEW